MSSNEIPPDNDMYANSLFRRPIIPIDLCSIILTESNAEYNILDKTNQIYGKALDGEGSIKFKNGNTYEGNFLFGVITGEGTFTWSNGVKYKGEFQNNRLIGKGRFDWPDGSNYEGDVKDGLREGVGSFITPNSESIYRGEWQKGVRHGYGKLYFKSGACYEGHFFNGYKHGKGRMVYSNGNYYDGEWDFDKKKGKGVMVWMTTKEKYYGDWEENRQNGLGTHIWLESKGEGKFLRNRYEGEWKNGVRHGYGVFYYSNGSKYEGQWNNNIKDGFAVFIDEFGKENFIHFKDDKIHQEFNVNFKPYINKYEKIEINLEEIKDKINEQIEEPSPKTRNHSPKSRTIASSFIKKKPKIISANNENKNEQEIQQINKIEPNPFLKIMDIEDILIRNPLNDKELFLKNFSNMLLRHNPSFKKWYKYCSNLKLKDEEENENILTLSLNKFWLFVKELKIMCPKLKISTINRIYFEGMRNRFDINSDIDIIKKKINFLKAANEENHFLTMDTMDLFAYSIANKLNKNEKINYKSDLQKEEEESIKLKIIDIQNGNKPLLYRNFVDLIVRTAFLKYNENIDDLHRAIEKLITKNIEHLMENKKKKNKDVSFYSSEGSFKPNISEDHKNKLFEIFKMNTAKTQLRVFDIIDETILVKTLLRQLIIPKFIQDDNEKSIIYHQIERFFDSQESLSILEHNYLSMIAQSPTPLIEKKNEKEKKNPKDKEKEKEYIISKNKKICNLMETELIFEEYLDLLIGFFLKTKQKNLRSDDEIDHYLQECIETFIFYNKTKENTKEERIWPITEKEKLTKVVKEVRLKKKQELEEKTNKELEIQREQNERILLNNEDFDAKIPESYSSQNLEEEEDEDSNYY